MNTIPWRVQVGIVAAGYAAVILLSALLLYHRHMQYVNHPDDAAAAGGMYAAGDLILGIFIGCLFLVPTFLLVVVIRKSEVGSLLYARVLLGLSLTAPLTFLMMLPAVGQSSGFFGWFCLGRLFGSSLIIVGLVISWILSRFVRAQRLILYALGIESGTLAVNVGIFIFEVMRRPH